MIIWTLILTIIFAFLVGLEYGTIPGILVVLFLLFAWVIDIAAIKDVLSDVGRYYAEFSKQLEKIKDRTLQVEQRIIDLEEYYEQIGKELGKVHKEVLLLNKKVDELVRQNKDKQM
ncbi:MAG: hypothetical protein DRZ82_09860 [Thermoprotei archaeon]|nr:MAG: hypothetical protein DRZ82_09860 [Thermoprotei archaeon]